MKPHVQTSPNDHRLMSVPALSSTGGRTSPPPEQSREIRAPATGAPRETYPGSASTTATVEESSMAPPPAKDHSDGNACNSSLVQTIRSLIRSPILPCADRNYVRELIETLGPRIVCIHGLREGVDSEQGLLKEVEEVVGRKSPRHAFHELQPLSRGNFFGHTAVLFLLFETRLEARSFITKWTQRQHAPRPMQKCISKNCAILASCIRSIPSQLNPNLSGRCLLQGRVSVPRNLYYMRTSPSFKGTRKASGRQTMAGPSLSTVLSTTVT